MRHAPVVYIGQWPYQFPGDGSCRLVTALRERPRDSVTKAIVDELPTVWAAYWQTSLPPSIRSFSESG